MNQQDTIQVIKQIADQFALAVEQGADISTEYNKARMAINEIKQLST